MNRQSQAIKAPIIIDQPNFLFHGMQLMESYFIGRNEMDDESWINQPLIRRTDSFILPQVQIDQTFQDLVSYLRHTRREAVQLLHGHEPLATLFCVSVRDEKGEAKDYFFGIAQLLMADVDSARSLTRDEFVIACLRRLGDLSELSDELEADSKDANADHDPSFTMEEIFTRVNKTLLSDADRMVLLRFFQDIDVFYTLVRDRLEKLEDIYRRHFPLIEKRFMNKAALYQEQGDEAFPVKLLYRLVEGGEEVNPLEPVHIAISPVHYNGMSIRFMVGLNLRKLVSAGLIYDDLEELKNRQKMRREDTEEQLKALADPGRLSIIRLLSIRRYYVQELADELGLSPATLSHHLKILMQAMLVSVGIEGRRSYYSLNRGELGALAQELQQMADTLGEE